MLKSLTNSRLAKAILFASLAAPASAAAQSIPSVVVTVENAQPSRGIFLTPPWLAIHDGTFDTYNGGAVASVPLGGNEIEALAEDGNNGPLATTFENQQPGAPQVTGLPGPFGPLAPGDSAGVTFNVDPYTNRYFSYASMIIPSNDFFIANGNPLAHRLFNDRGRFIGQDFIVSGEDSNDAGTEANDEHAPNVAFLNQSAPNTGVAQNLPVSSPAPGFAERGATAFPDGVLNHPVFANADFNDADDRLFKVSFRYVDLGGDVTLRSRLSADEVISPDAVNSRGRARADLTARNGRRVRIDVNVTRPLSGPVTAAYLHLGREGANGPAVVDLGRGVRRNGVRLSVTEGDLIGELGGEEFVSFLNELAAGNIYINLHTAEYPNGEIRGQVTLR